MSCISEAIRIASESWRPIQDIFDIAETFTRVCNLALAPPSPSLSKEEVGKNLVERIEKELHPYTDAIRSRTSVQLTEDLSIYPEFSSIEEALTKSLFIWVGCIQIDKACRKNDAS